MIPMARIQPLMANKKKERFREAAAEILAEKGPLCASDLAHQVRLRYPRSCDVMTQAVKGYLAGDIRFCSINTSPRMFVLTEEV